MATQHDQTLFGETVSNMFDQTEIESQKQAVYMDTSERASPKMFDKAAKRPRYFTMFDQMFDGGQILSNTIKQHQTRCPKKKMSGHQTMFDRIWSPNISRLDRAFCLRRCVVASYVNGTTQA